MTTEPSSTGRGAPWGWIGLCAVLAVVAIGVGIYAMQTKSDLDDANETIARQQQQLSEAESGGGAALDTARAAAGQLIQALGVTQDDVEALQQQVDDAAAKVEDAQARAEEAAGDARARAEAERDAAVAQADEVKACAQSALAALRGIFDADSLSAGVQAAMQDLQALQPQCGSTLSG
jgi:hypothetical protein